MTETRAIAAAIILSRPFCLTIFLVFSFLIPKLSWSQSPAPSAAPVPKSPVDTLIPWLLQEGTGLRGIPFGEVILAATGEARSACRSEKRNGSTRNQANQRRAGRSNAATKRAGQRHPRYSADQRSEQPFRRLHARTPQYRARPQLRLSAHRARIASNVRVTPIFASSIRKRSVFSISIRSFTRSAAATVVSARSISSRKERPTKCATMPCISLSASSMKSEAAIIGTLLAGTSSTLHISK